MQRAAAGRLIGALEYWVIEGPEQCRQPQHPTHTVIAQIDFQPLRADEQLARIRV
jgi:hypothetical protein